MIIINTKDIFYNIARGYFGVKEKKIKMQDKKIDEITIKLLEIQNKLKNNIISNLETLEDVEILRLVNAIVEESNRINKKNHRRE